MPRLLGPKSRLNVQLTPEQRARLDQIVVAVTRQSGKTSLASQAEHAIELGLAEKEKRLGLSPPRGTR